MNLVYLKTDGCLDVHGNNRLLHPFLWFSDTGWDDATLHSLDEFHRWIILAMNWFCLQNNKFEILHIFLSLVYLKYSIGATCISIYGSERGTFDCSEPYCIYRSPTSILEEFGIQESDYWTDMVILIGLFLLARLVAYCFLRRKIIRI